MPRPIELDSFIFLNRTIPKAFKDSGRSRSPDLQVENKADAATIRIYDTIGPDWAGMVGGETVARALESSGNAKEINVHINSPGGDVFEGLAIYNQLVRHPATVNVTIDGIAASAASYIAMAGDTVAIAKAGRFMVHPPSSMVWGYAAEMRGVADLLDKIQESITGIYVDRTGRTAEEITEWVNAETYMTAEEAVDRGFADSIVENKTGGERPAEDAPENNGNPAIRAKNRARLLELEAVELFS